MSTLTSPTKHPHHQTSRGDALSTQHITSQPTDFTSLAECATVDILAFSSRSVVYGHARQVRSCAISQHKTPTSMPNMITSLNATENSATPCTSQGMCKQKSAYTLSHCLGHPKTLTVTCPIRSWPPSSYTELGRNKHNIRMPFDLLP